MFDDKLYVGKVGKSVGLKGENRLIPDTDFLEQFKAGSRFETKHGTLVVDYYDDHRGLIKFQNISTPEAAKKLTNSELYTTLDATKTTCKLKDGEFFWFDVIDCAVYDGTLLLGTVTSIERLEPTDYLQIQTSPDLVAQGFVKSFLIPYVDRYIKETLIDEKRIFVEGGMDLLEAS